MQNASICSDQRAIDVRARERKIHLIERLSPFMESRQGPWEIGRVNHYSVVDLLGVGGMGAVFLAINTANKGELVALKVLLPWKRHDFADVRFRREIKKHSRIRHDNVVQIFESGMTKCSKTREPLPYFVMEYISGQTLKQKLKVRHRLPEVEAVRVCRELCRALDAIHQAGIVHRDIKPGNVMFDLLRRERTKLMDFGIAFDNEDKIRRLTRRHLIGTPAYMAPERIQNPAEVRPQSDLFSVGCVMYEMLAGANPFDKPDANSIIASILTMHPREIPNITEELSQLVMELLADESRRPASAAIVQERLEQISRGSFKTC
jgi:serine/threonine-protein kinase